MTGQSTAKMLASMLGKSDSQSPEKVIQESGELFSVPQLRPTSDMENILANILGPSASKKCSPMD